MFCSNCGTKLPEGARFCSNCGAKLEAVTPAAPTGLVREEAHVASAPKQEPQAFSFDNMTQAEEPKKAAFDRRVSFDWTSVIDESHKRKIKDIRSPWDTSGLGVEEEDVAPVSKVVEASHVNSLAAEFEGIDVTPTTDKGRTLTFIEILKKEREEKERAAEEAAKAYDVQEKTEDFGLFDDFIAAAAEPAPVEPEAELESADPAPAADIDAELEAYRRARMEQPAPEYKPVEAPVEKPAEKIETPAFELPVFEDVFDEPEEEEVPAPAQPAKREDTVDMYLALDEQIIEPIAVPEMPELSMEDLDDQEEEPTPVAELEPVAEFEPVALAPAVEPEAPVVETPAPVSFDEELAELEEVALDLDAELAAILEAGNGFIPTVEPVAEPAPAAPSEPAIEVPVIEEPVVDEPLTAEEAEAEEIFSEMIGEVTDPANDPLADVDHLTLEDIFGEEAAEEEAQVVLEPVAAEPVAEPVAELVDEKDAEIAALKQRLAELLGGIEEEETPVPPAAEPAPTIEEIFETEDLFADLPEEEEPEEETAAPEVPVETEASAVAAEEAIQDDFLALFDDEDDKVIEPSAPVVSEPVVEETAPVKEEEPLIELGSAVAEPVVSEIIESDAMSIEELEKDLFGDDIFGDDTEVEATRKIDKFYTLYKKNEEFQKLLDDEYSRLQIDEEPVLEDTTVGQLDDLLLQIDEIEEPADGDVLKPITAKEVTKFEAPTPEIIPAPAAATGATTDTQVIAAPALEEEKDELDPKAAKKAAKKAKKEAARKARELALEEDEEEGSTFLTIIAVLIAIILVLLLAAILILNFAPESALGLKLDSIVQSLSALPDDVSDGFLL